MLQQARARKRDGYDVVVGVVETHGRKETEALLDGLEVIPRRRIEYKGQSLEEMDLDAILARRPQIVLVDELAHTNAPGSRHPKRYLDVEELLQPASTSTTTVNIQHIESLNDVVAQITHVRVRETVPDSIFDRADAVELVDLTPDDLIQRLKEGKVYVPEAGRAGARALLLAGQPDGAARAGAAPHRRARRRAAAHADAGARHPGPVGGGRARPGLRQRGSRAPPAWCATPSAWRTACTRPGPRSMSRAGAASSSSEEQRDRIADTLRLAQALGGEAVTIPGGDRRIADDVIAYAQANNVTQIVIGKSTRSRWFEMLHGSVVHDLVRRSGNISVHVIAGEELAASRSRRRPSARPRRRSRSIRGPIVGRAGRGRAGARRRACSIRPWLGIENVDLVFLTAIVAVAVRFGLWPSLFASVVASLCYNFFFLPPVYTFTIADPTNVAALCLLHRHGGARLERGGARAHAGGRRDGTGARRPSRSTPSAASSPASARSTTCCGRPPTRPR